MAAFLAPSNQYVQPQGLTLEEGFASAAVFRQPQDSAASPGDALLGPGALSSLAGLAAMAWGLTKGRQRQRSSKLARRGALVFIDGEAGTTGLQVLDRLTAHPDIEVLSLPREQRKDKAARKEAIRKADAAVLCLPDEAAKAAVQLAEGSDTVIVDASTAYRVADGWIYGFPEMSPEQRAGIAASKRISNPGCYPTGFISLVKPLVDRGLIPRDTALTVPAISGYSGGGKDLIKMYESGPHEPWGAYNLNLAHKHLAEMAKWTGLDHEPFFMPAVADFLQGMVVSVPLRLSQLAPGTTPEGVQKALADHYEGQRFVSVAPLNPFESLERGTFMRPDTLANTNQLELFVFANEEKGTMWLLARLDNLGKGASGACVQNLNLALGFDEAAGLL